jgi:hypothetical protein
MDLIVRSARRRHHPDLVDIGIAEGRIQRIEPRLTEGATREIDAIMRDVKRAYTVGLTALEGVLAARERCRRLAHIELIAFPQEGILCDEGSDDRLVKAMERGADVVGGMPFAEMIDTDCVRHTVAADHVTATAASSPSAAGSWIACASGRVRTPRPLLRCRGLMGPDGRVVLEGPSAEVTAREHVQTAYLGGRWLGRLRPARSLR